MEIVHVIRQYKPSIGGLEDATANLCRYLARIPGVTVRVVTLDRIFTDPHNYLPANEVIDGIPVTRIPYSGSTRYPVAPKVLTAIKGADIVHVHAIDFFFDFLSLTRYFHRIPLVASTHGGFFHTRFAARLKRLYFGTVTWFSALGYKTICASSENDAANFRRIASNVVTIENGVNIDKWHDAGSSTPQRRLIFIGRWSANKQVPVLVRLIAALRANGQDWQLTIAGLAADETAESLAAIAQKEKVADAVQIVASPSEQDIKALIGQSSYIASASAYEGFGISIIEGLSAGLFPVVTPLPPFERLIGLLGFGVHIDTLDLVATAASLQQAHDEVETNPGQYRATAMELSKRYAWDGVAASFYETYKTVLR